MIMSVYDELGEEGFIEACSMATNKLLQYAKAPYTTKIAKSIKYTT